ncbi:response regulator transcription factor [Lacticaseibacillus jixianensis]|uniref:Response regulator transcription factor n=1 Tax=Lacticaseibacillus jixianensis TaxID=2486012 RepID=A0ABW4B6M3_9LACO|nr:response regulator transcription factor [Lacticaseibacillus jixianensis]
MKLLIIEDEPVLRQSMVSFFSAQYQVTEAGALAEASQAVAAGPDTIILDLTLPDGDGLAWLHTWRPHLPAKVLVLTANDQEQAELAGLQLADDFVVKPVSLAVLAARLGKFWPDAPVRLGEVAVNLVSGRVTKAGVPVTLSATEWRLLKYLVQHRGQLVSREQLIAGLWDAREAFVADNTLTVTIKRLREKLETKPTAPQLIRTIRGVGYFLNDQT